MLGPSRGTPATGTPAQDETTQRDVRVQVLETDDAPTVLFRDLSATVETSEPLLGQEATLATIRAVVKRAYSNDETCVLALEGGRGSGKTRLLQAASELAAKSWYDLRILYVPCRIQDGDAFGPFSRILLERFGVSPASAPAQVRKRMGTSVAEALPAAPQARVEEITHLLGHVAGVPFPESRVLARLEQNPGALREGARQAVATFLQADANRRPLLLLVDDLAADAYTAWQLLDTLLTVRAPIALIVTGAPGIAERIEGLDNGHRAEHLAIPPLSREQTRHYLSLLLPALRDPPNDFVAALHHRCRGIPGAVRGLLEAVEKSGLIFHPTDDSSGLRVDMERLDRDGLPLTTGDVIRAQVARLPEQERSLLESAAAIGERFWEGALLALERSRATPTVDADTPRAWRDTSQEDSLRAGLERLSSRRLIVRITDEQRAGLAEYTFQDTRTRAVLYADMDEDERRRRHAVIARWLSEASGLESVAELIAPHLARSGQPGLAGRQYLRAAIEERSRKRTTMALRLVEKALPLLDENDVTMRLDALHEHGSLLTVLGRYDLAEQAFRQMLKLAWMLGTRGRAGAALNRLARIRRWRGELSEALEYLQAALELFQQAADRRGVAATYDDMAQLHRLRGAGDAALGAAKRALEMRTALGDKRGEALALNTIASLELDRGEFDAAESHLNTSLALREVTGDHEGVVQTRLWIGRLAHERGDYAKAIELYRKALSSAREMNDQRLQSYLLNGLGETWLASGRTSDAQAALLDAQALASDMRDQPALSEIERNLGLLALAKGDGEAGTLLNNALSLAQRHGTRSAVARAHLGMARLSARVSDADPATTAPNAMTSYQECIRMFGESGSVHELARSQAEYGYFLLERGEVQEARTRLREAQAVLQRLALPERERVERTLKEI